jgi:hypothetical protein
MVVIRTYTLFRDIMGRFGAAGTGRGRIEEVRRGALDITEAVLYVKQHSVNCIAAAMYAMTSFDSRLFPPKEAEAFALELFRNSARPGKEDGKLIREHIITLYRRFLAEGKNAPSWETPLIDFLFSHPKLE